MIFCCFCRKMFRTASKTALLAAVAVKASPRDVQTSDNTSQLICKPSDLPIYSTLFVPKQKVERQHLVQQSALREHLESGIRAVRTEVQSGYNAVAKQANVINDYIEVGKAHTQQTIDYLNEPQNTLPRSGAIAIGGLAGFIFAARGGFIKKVLYTSIGAGAVASLCYPQQAEEQAKLALVEGRKAYAVAYNFVKGVKPGDEVPVETISKFPTSVDDLKNLALDLYDEAKDVLFPKQK